MKDPGRGTEIINGFLYPLCLQVLYISLPLVGVICSLQGTVVCAGEWAGRGCALLESPRREWAWTGQVWGRPLLESVAVHKKSHNLLFNYFLHFTLL